MCFLHATAFVGRSSSSTARQIEATTVTMPATHDRPLEAATLYPPRNQEKQTTATDDNNKQPF